MIISQMKLLLVKNAQSYSPEVTFISGPFCHFDGSNDEDFCRNTC